MSPRLTELQRQKITAALFRQEPTSEICEKYGISLRNLRRISSCLRTYGTTVPPKEGPSKRLGRPRKMNEEMVESLRQYVEEHPLANMKDIQDHIESKFDFEAGRALITRRLREMGYSLSTISSSVTSVDKDNLPLLTQQDAQRLRMDPNSNGIITTGYGSVYAWVRTPGPVPRRVKVDKDKSQTATTETDATTTTEQGQPLPLNSGNFSPDLVRYAQESQVETPATSKSPSVLNSTASTPAS